MDVIEEGSVVESENRDCFGTSRGASGRGVGPGAQERFGMDVEDDA